VTEKDQHLLLEVEPRGVHVHLAGRGEALAAALAVDAPQAGAQRRGARGPDQLVAVVERVQHAVELVRPALGGVRTVLGRPEGVVGDEQLRALRREGPP
jgi:hypothetical protein